MSDMWQQMTMIWDFIQNQILGMKWLNELTGSVLSTIGLDITSRIGGSVQFFIYDVLKITILLCCLIYMISYIQSYFPPERSKKIMGRFHGIWANCISALLGTVTPFCSCSSIPLFIGFTSAGLPLGVTFSFLISSPMVDLGSLILLMSIFGTKVAIIYVVVGLVIAVIGALIHNWIPESWVETILGSNNPLGVILAALIGVPMYADIFGTIPVVEALLYKGAQLGTILAFMMAVTTLSLPSVIMLRKAVKPKLLGVFITICTVGIIIVGYLFNMFQFLLI